MFTIEERRSSNVKGKTGKKQLDPCRMQCVHDVSFDEAGRRLHHSKISKENNFLLCILLLRILREALPISHATTSVCN